MPLRDGKAARREARQSRTRLAGEQVSTPWEPLQDPIQEVASGVQGLLPQTGYNPDPYNLGDAAQGVLKDTMLGKYLGDPNPHLADIYKRGAGDIEAMMARQAIKQGVNLGDPQYVNAFGDALGNLYSGLYAPAYAQERGLMQQATMGTPGILGSMAQVPYAPYQAAAGVLGQFSPYGTQSVFEPDTPRDRFRQGLDTALDIAGTVIGFPRFQT